ncbi:MAG TPA: response regulator, partial [Bryobacteraceae bacterium]|nr:response regulator [Bryobacteraceae bacterium]
MEDGNSEKTMFDLLVVEDDPATVFLLREILKDAKHRHTLHVVENGLEALDFLHRRGRYAGAPRPNLILLDLNMPKMDGLQVLSHIKADPHLLTIPVIVLSCSSHTEDVRKAYEAHANCYVQKPPDLERSFLLVQA